MLTSRIDDAVARRGKQERLLKATTKQASSYFDELNRIKALLTEFSEQYSKSKPSVERLASIAKKLPSIKFHSGDDSRDSWALELITTAVRGNPSKLKASLDGMKSFHPTDKASKAIRSLCTLFLHPLEEDHLKQFNRNLQEMGLPSDTIEWLKQSTDIDARGKKEQDLGAFVWLVLDPLRRSKARQEREADNKKVEEERLRRVEQEEKEAEENRIEWTKFDSPSRWARAFGFSPDTLMRRIRDGQIRARALSSKLCQIAIDDLPESEKQKHRPR